jgi:hypothetical protein
MKKSLVDIGKLLRSPDGYKRVMDMLSSSTSPPQRLTGGTLRKYILGVNKTFAPGEKSVLATEPLEYDFQLEYVMVPESVTFRDDEPVLFFHHEQIVPDIWKPGFGSKLPACLALTFDSNDMQLRDLYKKHVYAKGEIFELGIFENVGDAPLLVRAAVGGIARTDG